MSTPTYKPSGNAQFVYAPGQAGGEVRTASDGRIIHTQTLESAILIALHSYGRADPEDTLPSEGDMVGGWWADELIGEPLPSKVWLLSRSKITADTISKGTKYHKLALQWLIDDGWASSVDVAGTRSELSNYEIVYNVVVHTVPAIEFSWSVNLNEGV
jgi:phage gp46-like protein